MNLLLLNPDDFVSETVVKLQGRQLQHVIDIHKATVGDTVRVGRVNGLMGEGRITALTSESMAMDVSLTEPPPAALPLTVLLALPRPLMLKRSLQHLTSLGVKQIVLMHCNRVEKSYWQSPNLSDGKIHEQLVLGLEQARDTVLPTVMKEQRFKPFVEDRLPDMMQNKRGLVAHPDGGQPCPHRLKEEVVLAIGPEGGFVPFEVDKLEEAGFERIHLGPRILRVETAVTAITSKLYD